MATNLRSVRRGYADIGGGLQMYYETMGEGYPLILLHQSWWNSFEFEGVIPLLAKHYQVFAFDTLGFGFSPPAPEAWEFSDFTDSVVRAMDFLGLEKAHFGGMHTGALIMADLDARHKDRCDCMCYGGLAIYDEALRKKKYSYRRMIGQNQAPYVKVLQPGDVIGHEGALLQRKADGSHMLEYWTEQVRENPDSKLEYVQRAMMANLLHYDKGGADALTVLLAFDLKRALRFCTKPSLQLIGSRDVVKRPVFETIETAASLMKSTIKKFKVIYGAGIMGWLDYPQEYADAVVEFLKDPAGYEGTTGHELDLAMREYLLMVPAEAQFIDPNRYPDSAPARRAARPVRKARGKARRR